MQTEAPRFTGGGYPDASDIWVEDEQIASIHKDQGLVIRPGSFRQSLSLLEDSIKQWDKFAGNDSKAIHRNVQVEFRMTMNPHALDIYLYDKEIGSLQWHNGPYQFVSMKLDESTILSISVMKAILHKRDTLVEAKSKAKQQTSHT